MKNKAKTAHGCKGQDARQAPAKAKADAKDKPAAKPQPAKAELKKDSKKAEPAKPAAKGGAKPVATPKPVAAKTQPVKAAASQGGRQAGCERQACELATQGAPAAKAGVKRPVR